MEVAVAMPSHSQSPSLGWMERVESSIGTLIAELNYCHFSTLGFALTWNLLYIE